MGVTEWPDWIGIYNLKHPYMTRLPVKSTVLVSCQYHYLVLSESEMAGDDGIGPRCLNNKIITLSTNVFLVEPCQAAAALCLHFKKSISSKAELLWQSFRVFRVISFSEGESRWEDKTRKGDS